MNNDQATNTTAENSKVPFLSIAAPVYNEEDNIESVVRHWLLCIESLEVTAQIVLCNDGSQDRTAEILDKLTKEIPNLLVVGGPDNHGYGHALSTAIKHCSGEYIATIDSDGQFDLQDLEQMLVKVQEEDCEGVTGYRVKKEDSLIRVLADRCLNLIVRVLFGTRLRDTNCALKLVRRDLMQSLNPEATGYPFPTEICMKLEARGVKLGETPVRHLEREAGISKLKVWNTGMRMLGFLLYLRLRLWLVKSTIIREI